MKIIQNRYCGAGLGGLDGEAHDDVSSDVSAVRALLAQCPKAAETPLVDAASIADRIGVAKVFVKDERDRMGVGSFKALGAAYVIAREAEKRGGDDIATRLAGVTYVAASAGNHGISVAAGARVFGAQAVIYLSQTVPQGFADRLREIGATVVRAGEDYDASLEAAMSAANDNGWTLLADTSWPGYTEIPYRVMEGYLAMAAEAGEQLTARGTEPTHILLQAGVGGLAAAAAVQARKDWGVGASIIVVEPEAAPALQASIKAGGFARGDGPVSCMGRLDCKEPSILTLASLSRDANTFLTIGEDEAQAAMPALGDAGLATTPSGGAGLAALLAMDEGTKAQLGLDETSVVLTYLSEGPDA